MKPGWLNPGSPRIDMLIEILVCYGIFNLFMLIGFFESNEEANIMDDYR